MNISIEEMPREIARLEDENELLQDRIDKAIEYIKNNNILLELLGDQKVKKELLEILKGSE